MKNQPPNHISHLKCLGNEWWFQDNESHSEGVASLATQFAKNFDMGDWGYVLGKLHDKGKERESFQQHIKFSSGFDSGVRVEGDHHHAYVGGLLAKQLYPQIYQLLDNPLMGHHRGLYDYNELKVQEGKHIPDEVNCNIPKTELRFPPFFEQGILERQDFHHLERMLFSCLVDADYLDTESFMNPESAQLRKGKLSLIELMPKLSNFLSTMKSNAKPSPVNSIRNEVQQFCVNMSEREMGFYSLTVPTGGGKTLSSLVWAMRHAVHHGLKRIIIAIPYTSIIVQTASVLKGIFGEENVLEHHSNIDPEKIRDKRLGHQMRLAMENWDYPIIVTTNVQLFESMMSNKPSHCRKLHNIAQSVILLDEVQTLPTEFLQPIVDTLKTYQKLFKVSVLFTTASQPVLSGLIEGCNPQASFKGIDHITKIIPSDLNLHDRLRRVRLSIDNEGKTYDQVAEQLCCHPRVLCVVNTRKDAQELYQRLPQEGITLHLSRMMCPDHIRETINMMKEALKHEENSIIRVVATQLIEAGVDIDFPVVYRQEAGLDSVLQAAGRCNREGKSDICTTYVFSLSKEKPLPCGNMQEANAARLSLQADSDWFAPSTMTSYFEQLYCRKDTFDKKDMRYYLYNPKEMCFETAAAEFKLIEDDGIAVVVNWEDSLQLLETLKQTGPTYELMKKLGTYSVSVKMGDMKKLTEMGAVEEVVEGVYCVREASMYDPNVGLKIENHWLEEIHII